MGLAEFLREQTRDTNEGSLAQRLRGARFAQFEELIASVDSSPVKILDIGGTNAFWESRGLANNPSVEITTANLLAEEKEFENITPIAGDATSLPQFPDMSFDIVFSNSTIEHVFTRHAQASMAAEIRRLAPIYYVQTPNYWFPVEPHYLFPGWQWLPQSLRVAVVRRRKVGHWGPYPDPTDAWTKVEEVRMLSHRQMRELFPDAEIVKEPIGPLVKSWIAVRRAPAPARQAVAA